MVETMVATAESTTLFHSECSWLEPVAAWKLASVKWGNSMLQDAWESNDAATSHSIGSANRIPMMASSPLPSRFEDRDGGGTRGAESGTLRGASARTGRDSAGLSVVIRAA